MRLPTVCADPKSRVLYSVKERIIGALDASLLEKFGTVISTVAGGVIELVTGETIVEGACARSHVCRTCVPRADRSTSLLRGAITLPNHDANADASV